MAYGFEPSERRSRWGENDRELAGSQAARTEMADELREEEKDEMRASSM